MPETDSWFFFSFLLMPFAVYDISKYLFFFSSSNKVPSCYKHQCYVLFFPCPSCKSTSFYSCTRGVLKRKKNLNYKAQTLNTINSSKALNADRNEIVKKNNVLNVRVRLVENGIETIKPRLKKTNNISYFSAMVEQPS